jgi:uncharacterized membrane protein
VTEPPAEGDEGALSAADNSMGRLLALSDGVFAIALTLLALDLKVPALGSHSTNGQLVHALRQNASSYLSFLISFYVVAGYWIRHRRLMRSVHVFDTKLIGPTIFLLLTVSALPFPAALLGMYGSKAISMVVYGGVNAVAVLALLRLHQIVRDEHLEQAQQTKERGDVHEVGELAMTLVVFLLCIPSGSVFHGKGPYVLVLLGVVGRWALVVKLARELRKRV